MTSKIFFQDAFLVSGIMCYENCGLTVRNSLNVDFEKAKKKGFFSKSVRLIIDSEPATLGIHRILITLECNDEDFKCLTEEEKQQFSLDFKKSIDGVGFDLVDLDDIQSEDNKLKKSNWINILLNLTSILVIIGLSIFLPASIPLTIGLTTLSFATTAFTARDYLMHFVRNIRASNIMNMTTTVSLGWLLSLAHTLYHTISMPLMSSFSMIFMSYVMPVTMIALINGMDEIKHVLMNKSKKMHLRGMKTLFPQMAEEYEECTELTEDEHAHLSQLVLNGVVSDAMDIEAPFNVLNSKPFVMKRKSSLTKGMIIHIKPGECFPVDCQLIQGNTVVDASLLTGESQQNKQHMDFIPAGAVNIGQMVTVYALEDAYHSTVNKIILRSHRGKEPVNVVQKTNLRFTYVYTFLIVTGIVAAVVVPWALGIMTVPLLLQNITGILFGVCPCTAVLAHELPNLLSIYRRGQSGIVLRDEQLSHAKNKIHTVVFDKTGTLTTGNSQVESSSSSISASLWERIYLLEKRYGAEHPLAKAITKHYETTYAHQSVIQDITNMATDPKGRGLSALVQGRQIHIGNRDYLKQSGIDLPEEDTHKIAQGFSAIYVAEDNVYQGAIYIKHEVRKDILAALSRLKRDGVKIIMLTGDAKLSAIGFNQQNGNIFDEENIHAAKTPEGKETFMKNLMGDSTAPQGVWFVGDGLNDAPCSRLVTEKKGISCAMTSDAKAAFFTDISLNGSLDYLFEHHKINHFLKKNVLQNQFLLSYGAIAFLAFIISFSIAGIAVSPIISLLIMLSTTLFVLFNANRAQLVVDNALSARVSWSKQLMASDWSIGLLVGTSFFLFCGLIISTLATGGLTLPVVAFTAGTAMAMSSSCTIAAGLLFSLFSLLAVAHLCEVEDDACDDLANSRIHHIVPQVRELEIGHDMSDTFEKVLKGSDNKNRVQPVEEDSNESSSSCYPLFNC